MGPFLEDLKSKGHSWLQCCYIVTFPGDTLKQWINSLRRAKLQQPWLKMLVTDRDEGELRSHYTSLLLCVHTHLGNSYKTWPFQKTLLWMAVVCVVPNNTGLHSCRSLILKPPQNKQTNKHQTSAEPVTNSPQVPRGKEPGQRGAESRWIFFSNLEKNI